MTDTNQTAKTRGIHHLGLTVPNLAQTQAFFTDTLGYNVLGEVPDYPAVFLSDGTIMLTLWQATDPANATPFDRKNVIGLHHFALGVDNHAALEDMHQTLTDAQNVDIEFSPEALGDGGARHMMCNIPGGIRVEFISASA